MKVNENTIRAAVRTIMQENRMGTDFTDMAYDPSLILSEALDHNSREIQSSVNAVINALDMVMGALAPEKTLADGNFVISNLSMRFVSALLIGSLRPSPEPRGAGWTMADDLGLMEMLGPWDSRHMRRAAIRRVALICHERSS